MTHQKGDHVWIVRLETWSVDDYMRTDIALISGVVDRVYADGRVSVGEFRKYSPDQVHACREDAEAAIAEFLEWEGQ